MIHPPCYHRNEKGSTFKAIFGKVSIYTTKIDENKFQICFNLVILTVRRWGDFNNAEYKDVREWRLFFI